MSATCARTSTLPDHAVRSRVYTGVFYLQSNPAMASKQLPKSLILCSVAVLGCSGNAEGSTADEGTTAQMAAATSGAEAASASETAEDETSATGGSSRPTDSSTTQDDPGAISGAGPDGATGDPSSDTFDDSSDGLWVYAAGAPIGRLQGVSQWLVGVWDPAQDVAFSVNRQTGYVAGGAQALEFASDDCTGEDIYDAISEDFCDAGIGAPATRNLIVLGGNALGLREPSALYLAHAAPDFYRLASRLEEQEICNEVTGSCDLELVCSALTPRQYCALPVIAADGYTTAYPLPVTIE